MRLSIRYWLRRWLVPELEPSPQESLWSGHDIPNVVPAPGRALEQRPFRTPVDDIAAMLDALAEFREFLESPERLH